MRRSKLSLLLLLGIFCIGLLTLTACSSKNYVENVYEIDEKFSDISIKTDTADILFLPSEDGTLKVACHEHVRKKHFVEVQNGVLIINAVDNRKWYDYIEINIGSPKITVYLPELEYSSLVIEESTGDIEISNNFKFKSIDVSLSTGDVKCYASATETIKIEASTGDVTLESISASALDISVSTGDVTVSHITCGGEITVGVSTGKTYFTDTMCKNLISTGSTGDILLKNVISTEKIYIKRSTGDVTLEGSDAAELFITTSTGDVKGSLLTDKVFIAKTDTGRISVPKSTTGGRCEITTDTGDIKISILNG